MADDEEDEPFGGAYEDGHWIWDDKIGALNFISDIPLAPVEAINIKPTATLEAGAMTFNEDVDLLEQVRFRKRYARKLKPGQPDIITLQDVKDLALFTAPVTLLSRDLINLLHMPTAERFIRALILYCQYYLQVEEKMEVRMAELDKKVRTPDTEMVEAVFRENLSDLKCLVAKEYSILLIGGADTIKFHHMGPAKKRKSLTNKDARLFESFLRMSIQIVWLALSRRSFNKLELEINRLFKTDTFNVVEHTLKTGYISSMQKEEANVLMGTCLKHEKKLVLRSPLMNEAFCPRPIDYRMLGLGVIEYENYSLGDRLKYMLMAVAGSESDLLQQNVVLGIVGLPRSYFDTMLRVLPTALDTISSKKIKSTTKSTMGGSSSISRSKSGTSPKKGEKDIKYIYNDVILPSKVLKMPALPEGFPDTTLPPRPCSDVQRRRWLLRLYKLRHPSPGSRRCTLVKK